VPKSAASSTLRRELERALDGGRCVYCRRPASPERPLTREHVIPQARGGKRKDVRIIVPACARCNHRRGCRELVVFLLLRPRRISSFLDYLGALSPESIRQMDLRVFAELYAALWMLNESVECGSEWRAHLKRLCMGRSLHRRRYAARRMVGAAEDRLESRRGRGVGGAGPSCLLPLGAAVEHGPELEEPLEQLSSRLLGILALAWQVPAEEVDRELSRQHQARDAIAVPVDEGEGVVELDGWQHRRRRRRTLRVDRRGGRASRPRRVA
jgi:hypothetical protein